MVPRLPADPQPRPLRGDAHGRGGVREEPRGRGRPRRDPRQQRVPRLDPDRAHAVQRHRAREGARHLRAGRARPARRCSSTAGSCARCC